MECKEQIREEWVSGFVWCHDGVEKTESRTSGPLNSARGGRS